MGFIEHVIFEITGKGKARLPNEMRILGASQELVNQALTKTDEEQERLFVDFVEGKHACLIDWRADGEEIYEELAKLLSTEEQKWLPPEDDVPYDASAAVAYLGKALERSKKALVHTESLGDFSFLILVPREKKSEFIKYVGPWLINAY